MKKNKGTLQKVIFERWELNSLRSYDDKVLADAP